MNVSEVTLNVGAIIVRTDPSDRIVVRGRSVVSILLIYSNDMNFVDGIEIAIRSERPEMYNQSTITST
jgi:hypothetical protein